MKVKNIWYIKFILNILLTLLGVALAVFLGWKLMLFFVPLVVGWIIAMIVNPLVRFLEKKVKLLRKHSSVIIIVAVLGLFIFLLYIAVVKIYEYAVILIEQLPSIYEGVSKDFTEVFEKLKVFYDRLPANWRDALGDAAGAASGRISDFISKAGSPTFRSVGNMAKNLPNIVVMVFFTILFAYFFIAERERIITAIKEKLPDSLLDKLGLIKDSVTQAFGGYFIAQFKIMGVVFVILLIGFIILKVRFYGLVAFLTAFLDMLPVFGTGTVLFPWALFEFLSSDVKMGVGLLVVYVISQSVRQIIQPKLVGSSVGIDPLLALFLMFVGYRIKGVVGIIIAIPVGLILVNLYKSGVFDSYFVGFRRIANDIGNFLNFREGSS